MDENIFVSSAQPNSGNESSEHIETGLTTLGSSSVVGEPRRGDMTSPTNTNFANNNSRLVLTQAPTQPSSGGEYSTLPHEPNDELAPSSSKRPRGRPRGSKNKPKNILVTEQIDNIMEPITLGIPARNDIVESLISFAQSRNASITVLSGSGPVADVTLLHNVSRAPTPPIKGPFNIISLKGTYINPNCGHVPPHAITNPPCSSFSIVLCGDQGQAFHGTIGGKVKAVGYVKVTATLLRNLCFTNEPHQ